MDRDTSKRSEPRRESLEKNLYLPPYDFKDAQSYMYLVRGDRNAIEEKVIRPALGPRFTVQQFDPDAQDYFVVAFQDYKRVDSRNPAAPGLGGFAYKESAVFVPVYDRLTREHFWFVPVLHCDSASILIAGREVYGFPKTFGIFGIPGVDEPGPDGQWHMSVYGEVMQEPDNTAQFARSPIREPISVDTGQGARSRRPDANALPPIMTASCVVPGDPGKGIPKTRPTDPMPMEGGDMDVAESWIIDDHETPEAFFDKVFDEATGDDGLRHVPPSTFPMGDPQDPETSKALQDELRDITDMIREATGAMRTVFRAFIKYEFNLLFVKSIPSAEDPNRTAYQAYVEVPVKLHADSRLFEARDLSYCRLTLNDFPSLELASSLGVAAGTEIAAVRGLWARMDLEMAEGIETPFVLPPVQVAILGGGLAGVATALLLTDPDNPQCDQFDVTIYQQGHRLGGKGASGRNLDPQLGMRIEEHGLHVWMGCYQNAFEILRKVYAEWGLPEGHPWYDQDPQNCWRHAFTESWFSCHVERLADGRWDLWPLAYPERPGTPGDEGESGCTNTLHFVSAAVKWIDRLARMLDEENDPDACLKEWLGNQGKARASTPSLVDRLHERIEAYHDKRWLWLVRGANFALSWVWLLYAAVKMSTLIGWRRRYDRLDPKKKACAERVFIFLDLADALVKGLAWNAAEVLFKGFDALDDYELRDFLRIHGAAEKSVNSSVVDSLYDGVFAVPEGKLDFDKQAFIGENLAAGAGIRSFMYVLLGYKGAPFWKMNAGMGDTIFTPAYDVLRARGVKFRFFHRVEELHLSEDRQRIASIDIAVQATPDPDEPLNGFDGSGAGHAGRNATFAARELEYYPLVDVDTEGHTQPLKCWPSEPVYDRIREGKKLKKALGDGTVDLQKFESGFDSGWAPVRTDTLQEGRDFDTVVLAISIGAFERIAGQLMEASEAFRLMVERVQTVRTEAYQMWLNKNLEELGWNLPSPVMGNFIDPLNTWADMTHLDAAERPHKVKQEDGTYRDVRARSIAYFVSTMPDQLDKRFLHAASPEDAHVAYMADRLREALVEDRTTGGDHFWPGAAKRNGSGQIERDADGKEIFDPDILLGDYMCANTSPSDRYVLTVSGSTKYRLAADGSDFENLILAGDWTHNKWNLGCVEGTVSSAMLACNAMSDYPRLRDIRGHDRI